VVENREADGGGQKIARGGDELFQLGLRLSVFGDDPSIGRGGGKDEVSKRQDGGRVLSFTSESQKKGSFVQVNVFTRRTQKSEKGGGNGGARRNEKKSKGNRRPIFENQKGVMADPQGRNEWSQERRAKRRPELREKKLNLTVCMGGLAAA